jgi:hypothetical protein
MSRSAQHVLHRDGRRQESLIGADLKYIDPVGHGQAVKAAVCCIQDAQPVAARLDLEIRRDFAVHQMQLTENFRDPGSFGIGGHRIAQLPVGARVPVEEHERNLIFAGR